MTSEEELAETSIEVQLMSPPNPKAKADRRQAQFWQSCCLIALSSLLISIYAVLLSQRLAPTASQHDLDQAAIMLADKLGRLTIKHNRFGNIGMLDIADGTHSQTSLNRIQATLKLDGLIAKKYGYRGLDGLVARDAKEASQLTNRLARLERDLAAPNADSAALGQPSLMEIVRLALAQTGAGGRLKAIKITLGGLKHSRFGSLQPLPMVPGEVYKDIAEGNNYRVHVNVQISENNTYQFYEIADAPALTSVQQFAALPENSVASVVLVEADFEVAERGPRKRIQKMQSCAIVGAPHLNRTGSVFMLSFPQGYFAGISCLSDLFSPRKYTAVAGEWYQALFGDVPGDGYLASAPNDLPPTPPSLAAMTVLYHYIFDVGPSLIPANLHTLLAEPLASIQVNSDDKSSGASYFNCGLFKDTGSARFALQRQSKGAEGKRLLNTAFSAQTINTLMPPYTFPLVVDSSGSLNLPQEKGFDQLRIKEFLDALYKTNIAGIESMQIGTTVIHRMQVSLDQSVKNISSLREEQISVRQTIKSLEGKPNDAERDKKMKLLQQQAESLDKAVKDEQAKQVLSLRIKAKAQVVVHNGKEAAQSSYEIGAHMASFTEKGFKTLDSPFRGFLLNKTVVFVPHTTPIDEDDLYEVDDSSSSNNAEQQLDPMSWTSPQFRAIQNPDPGMYVEKRPINDYLRLPPQQQANRPLFVMMSSSELMNSKTPSLFATRQTPFDNGAIARLQLCYFAPQCIVSGINNEVSWSILGRDLVYSANDGAGLPLLSLKPRWCLDMGMDEVSCPGLAAELQVRTPIPNLDQSFSGTYLQDPSGGPSVPMYPPLPAELI